jgi:secondary thiamine-phosphate synthase enzyme
MTKGSSITARRTPATEAGARVGTFAIHVDTLVVESRDRVELVDLTDRVVEIVRSSSVSDGLASIWSMHTTCSVFINENQGALHADIKTFLEETVDREGRWLHNDPNHSDCDRNNADAHLRAMILGHSLTVQVSGGELVLGQWQRIIAAELDGPRSRSLRVQVQGIGSH